ncbi:hypothetical protein AADG42_10105 [Ammonicoccus fulvus]|uniref:Helix-turn-helix domain-containing protein n=1 Tax=Ammonicoccus fulvus TaxID=3138240 RepID=A0ABZ3FNL0_9ACTN
MTPVDPEAGNMKVRVAGMRRTVPLPSLGGEISSPIHPKSLFEIGDRMVPSPIDVRFAGDGDQPAFAMKIEVIAGVPRCTELSLNAVDGGREIRAKDLGAIELDSWIEAIVARASFRIERHEDGSITLIDDMKDDSFFEGVREIRRARKNSRRPMTRHRLEQVAEIYNAQDEGGLEAIEIALSVSRSTAARYVRQAREEGLIK